MPGAESRNVVARSHQRQTPSQVSHSVNQGITVLASFSLCGNYVINNPWSHLRAITSCKAALQLWLLDKDSIVRGH